MFFRETRVFPTGGRSHYRIPSLVVTGDGTAVAFCNDRRDTVIDHAAESMLVCAVKKPGEAWGEPRILGYAPGWACTIGSAVYDRETGRIFCFARRDLARDEFGTFTDEEIRDLEEKADALAAEMGLVRGDILFVSDDGGETWREEPVRMTEHTFHTGDGRSIRHGGSCHGSAHGIQLRHGAYAGRLLCPSRLFTGRYSTWDEAILCCYNNSVYSDDHGATWHASAPVQQGTGEGTLIEDGMGVIHYNSRGMHRDGLRRLAASRDGGATYGDFRVEGFLREDKAIGCNASFLRVERAELPDLPEDAEAVTLFANPRGDVREGMTVCISLDDGETWQATRLVWAGGSAYSSLDYDPVSRHFFLLYEKGTSAADPYEFGVAAAEFDWDWLAEALEK